LKRLRHHVPRQNHHPGSCQDGSKYLAQHEPPQTRSVLLIGSGTIG
jgi:hypothetical protein